MNATVVPSTDATAAQTARCGPVLLADRLRRSLAHHPSPGPMLGRVLEAIDQCSATDLQESVTRLWKRVATSPIHFGNLFPSAVESGEIAILLRSFRQPVLSAAVPELGKLQTQWLAQELDLERTDSHLNVLLDALGQGPPPRQAHDYFARQFVLLDLLHATLVDPGLWKVVTALHTELHHQRLGWSDSYCGGYAYQGFEDIGIQGWKPSERRLDAYRINGLLTPADRIFDIGANSGFLAVHLGRQAQRVVGVELNPFLVRMGDLAAEHLGRNNVDLKAADFTTYCPDETFNVVFSLSNHHTIDSRLSMRFEEYILKCWSLLDEGGRLFFESHNVGGPGLGKPGDDGDLELKFDIVERWFELERSHMVRAFVPGADIDKLFVVLRKRSECDPLARRTLDLQKARQNYLDPPS